MTIGLSPAPPPSMKQVVLHSDSAVLDAQAHPAVLKRIIFLAPHSVKLAFRSTSRTAKGLADQELFEHVVVVQWGSMSYLNPDPSSLYALVSPDGHKLPGKPMLASNKAWERRLAQTLIIDSTVRSPYYQWAAIVRVGRPRILRRLISGGLWHAPNSLMAVDLLVLSPRSLHSKLGQDMLTATLVNRPGKHVINVLFDMAFRGAYFPTGSGGEKTKGHAVLIFNMLPLGGALHRHLYHPGDDDPIAARNMNLTSPDETFFDSLAQIVMSGVYVDYTLVGLDEVDHHLLGVDHHLTAKTIKARIVNLIRERQHRNTTLGLPPHIPAAELEESLTLLSHHDYRLTVGAAQYDIETWPNAPALWWSASERA